MLHLISIKGEVSNCKYHTSGHIYFTLKDKAGAMSAVMFAGNAKNMTFRMKDGDQVVVTGSVEVYEKMGTYQIYARQIELDGEGNLYLRFEQLKKELEEMGMFAAEYKRPIPKYAGKIGVVTAQTGAAIQDIRNISGRRNPYVQLILYPALVQGEGAAQSIVNGIHALDRMGLDIIIVGRGGGSIEDLWAFNEEIVARAIFECNTPVISAVGHETDWTIADFVSDRRAPTPSAAAELAVFDYRQMIDQLSNIKKRMDSNLSGKIEFYRERLSHIKTRVSYSSPANRLNENRKRLADLEERLLLLMQQQIKDKRQKLIMLSTRLDADSPVKKLSQGYAYVSKEDGRNIHSAADITCGDNIDIYLIDGRAKAVISEVDLNER
nr:exodeoxyribonuclease VII large subunit [uncultured Agathobacter sp.]